MAGRSCRRLLLVPCTVLLRCKRLTSLSLSFYLLRIGIYHLIVARLTSSYSLDVPPFMSYAASYALFNYTLADHSKGLDEYSNLRLVRGFERGLDPKSSEAGFILTHVDMVKETGALVGGVLKVVDSIEQRGDRDMINDGFREILRTMEKIETSMEGMPQRHHRK